MPTKESKVRRVRKSKLQGYVFTEDRVDSEVLVLAPNLEEAALLAQRFAARQGGKRKITDAPLHIRCMPWVIISTDQKEQK